MKTSSLRVLGLAFWLFVALGAPAFAQVIQYPGNGHYYEYVSAPGINWESARSAAASRQYLGIPGHLATLASADEDAWVRANLVFGQSWAGAHQPNPCVPPPDGWVWITGESWSHTYWGFGEPNDYYGPCSESHLGIHPGGWNDEALLANLSGYLVEYDSIPIPPLPYEPGPLSCPPAAPAQQCCDDGADSGALDPVYLFSGELYLDETDLSIPGRGLDFTWGRKYRSKTGPSTEIGHGWDWSYNVRLEQEGQDLAVRDGNSRRDVYPAQINGTWTKPEFFRELAPSPQGSGYRMTFEDTGGWEFHPFDGRPEQGKLRSIADRNGNTLQFFYDGQGRLATVLDTLDRPIQIGYDAQGRIATVTDFAGRVVQYDYYQSGEPGGSPGDLQSATTPAVTGTPRGNDYPLGKTTVYTYSSGFSDERLNHNLLTVTDPQGQTYVTNSYASTTNPNDLNFDRLTRQVWGDPGDVTDLSYFVQSPSAANGNATLKTIVNDRVGNVQEFFYDAQNRLVLKREYTGRAPDPDNPTTETANRPTGKLRATDPDYFETRCEYNGDSLKTRIVHPNGNEERFFYDEQNADPRARGNLLEHRRLPGPLGGDQAQISELYEYDTGFGGCCGTNFVIRETDGRGNVTEHDYDAQGNRVQTRRPVPGAVEDFEYNAFGQRTAQVLPDDGSGRRRRDEFSYYGSGPQRGYLQAEIADAAGLALTTTYEYDLAGNVTRRIDPRGNDTQFLFNQLDQLVREISPEVTPGGGVRHHSDFFYDANDNLVRVDEQNVDEGGQVVAGNPYFTTLSDFGILNEVLRTCREKGSHDVPQSQLSCAGLPAGEFVTEEYAYDANRNQTLVRKGEAVNGNQPSNAVRTLYDERDLVFQRIRAEGDPQQSTTQLDYDRNGNRTAEREGLESGAHVTTHAYDGYDRQTASTDPMGNEERWSYDANGNVVTRRVYGELSDGLGAANNVRLAETSAIYDALDRRTRVDAAHFDPATGSSLTDGFATTEQAYAPASLILSVTDDNGNTTSFAYDTAHRLSVVTDAKGNILTSVYDASDNVLSATSLEKSDLGSPDQSFTTSFAYDGLDRRVQATDSAGNVTRLSYDSRDNLVQALDALNRESRQVYDGLSRRLQAVRDLDGDGADPADAADIVLGQSWDDSLRLVQQTDDHGNATSYVYDALDRVASEVLADGTKKTTTYDVHDNPFVSTDANGSTVAHTFDALDRLTARSIQRGTGVSSQTTFESYAYDGRSRLVRALDDDALVTMSWSSLSDQIRETTRAGLTIQKNHDGLGNVLSCVYPGGRTIQCAYDALNRRKTISDAASGLIAAYDYFGPSRVERREFGNGTRTEYGYDGIDGVANAPGDYGSGQIVAVLHSRISDGMVLDQRSLAWNRVQNKKARADLRAGGPRWSHAYAYDAADRLVRSTVTDPAGAIGGGTGYLLDGVGNRVAAGAVGEAPVADKARPLPAGAYWMNPKLPQPADRQVNQYTATPFDQRGYDRNGNLTGVLQPGGSISFTYDYRDRLVQYSNGVTGTSATYRYDALGRRIEKSVTTGGPPVVTRFVYDGWREIEERDGSNAVQASYVHGLYIDELLQMRRGGQDYSFHADDLYNVTALSDAAGAVVERYEYDDFGTLIDPQTLQPLSGSPSALGNPFLFTGRRYDPESGLYEYRTRYLDPRAGRFLSRDRIGAWGDPDNLGNATAYVGNRSVTYLDPYGLQAQKNCADGRNEAKFKELRDQLEKKLDKALGKGGCACQEFNEVGELIGKIWELGCMVPLELKPKFDKLSELRKKWQEQQAARPQMCALTKEREEEIKRRLKERDRQWLTDNAWVIFFGPQGNPGAMTMPSGKPIPTGNFWDWLPNRKPGPIPGWVPVGARGDWTRW